MKFNLEQTIPYQIPAMELHDGIHPIDSSILQNIVTNQNTFSFFYNRTSGSLLIQQKYYFICEAKQ